MGIRGLPYYVGTHCNGIINTRYRLRNNRIIIDGNNFLRTFIQSLKHDRSACLNYGCNYDVYYTALEEFFNKLSRCHLQPVMVFVGTTTCQELIFERVKKRNEERMEKLATFLENNYSIKPRDAPQALLAKNTLVRFLNDHCIHHITLDFEEDEQIAALANRWRCPILTADSDFYLFGYKRGVCVVNVWNFDMKVASDMEGCYMEVPVYDVYAFAQYHKLTNINMVALFGAILWEKDLEANFMEFVPLVLEDRCAEIKNLLARFVRMAQTRTVEDIINDLEDFVDDVDDIDDLKERVRKKFDELQVPECKPEYCTFLEKGKTVVASSIRTLNGKCLPEWFIDLFRSGRVSRYCCGVLAKRFINLYTQLEDLDAPSPHEASAPIRAVCWGVLMKYDMEEQERPRVTEYYRDSRSMKERLVNPTFDLPGYGPVPGLDEIPDLDDEHRQKLFLCGMNCDVKTLRELPTDCWFFITLTRFWYVQCQPAHAHVQALLLCFLKLSVVDRLAEDLMFQASISKRSSSLLDWAKVHFDDKTLRFCHQNLKPKLSLNQEVKFDVIGKTADRIKVHQSFAQWLACFDEAYHLNNLLLEPVMDIGPHQCFRATFIFTYARELARRGDNAPEFLAQQLGGVRFYDSLFKPLWDAIVY